MAIAFFSRLKSQISSDSWIVPNMPALYSSYVWDMIQVIVEMEELK